MNDGQLFLLLILVAVGLTLGYFRGRRKNLEMARAISRELEAALHPKDQTYTWLGGVLGFKAEYRGVSETNRVEATLTLLPRHSLLYLPVAWLLSGGDRLFVVAYPTKPIKGEAHIVASSYRRRLGRLPDESKWRREVVEGGGRSFEVLGEDPSAVAGLRDWIRSLPQTRYLKHLALVPRTGTLYLFMVPAPGNIQEIVDRTLTWFGRQA